MKPLGLKIASLVLVLGSLGACAGNAGDGLDPAPGDGQGRSATTTTALRPFALPPGECVEVTMCMRLYHFDRTTCRCELNPSCSCDVDCEDGTCVDDPQSPGSKVCSRPPDGDHHGDDDDGDGDGER